MTVTISSSLRVALVSGTGVSFNAAAVPLISTDDVYNPDNPAQTLTDLLGAISAASLAGSATIDATTVGNSSVFTVAVGEKFIPTSIVFALTDISGSGDPPVLNAGFTGPDYTDFIDSSRSVHYDLTGGAFFAGGTGYAVGNVLTLVGGTHATAATVTLSSVLLASVSSLAAGTVYAPGDTITLTGGVMTTKPIVTVATVKLVSATITSGHAGTGYGNASTFDVTVAGGTHSVVATVNVTTDSGGIVTTINSISAAGNYTVLPTLLGNVVTGDNGADHGTGLELDLVFGVNTVTVSTPGEITTTNATYTQFATSGSGTGATFNTGAYGALGYTVSVAGDYSVIPSNHIATTGAGSGATFDATFEETSGMFDNIDTIGQILSVVDLSTTAGSSGADLVYMISGEVLKVRVAFASTYDTFTLKAFVFGFIFA